jgi:hypothetical protein
MSQPPVSSRDSLRPTPVSSALGVVALLLPWALAVVGYVLLRDLMESQW